MFGQENMQYAETIEGMELCQLKIDELKTKTYEDEYEAEIFTEFKKSAWLNVPYSTSETQTGRSVTP